MNFSLLLQAILFGSSAAVAQTDGPDPEISRALEIIEAHRVDSRTGCSIPMPVRWNASPWEQDAAMHRRHAFERCLSAAMDREQYRIEELSYRVADLRHSAPDQDWGIVQDALDVKWGELERLENKIRHQQNWADTSVRILDSFTGPGAPFDSSGYNSMNGGFAPFRRDSSTSAPGVK